MANEFPPRAWKWMLVLVSAACFVSILSAQPHSDNYILKKWAFSSGGGSMSSTNYEAVAVIGQSSPPGIATSPNYTLYSGFLQPMWALPGTALVWIWTEGFDVHLDWEDVANARTYYIYRSTDPDFIPAPSTLYGFTTDSQYIDESAVYEPNVKFFYKITCSN